MHRLHEVFIQTLDSDLRPPTCNMGWLLDPVLDGSKPGTRLLKVEL